MQGHHRNPVFDRWRSADALAAAGAGPYGPGGPPAWKKPVARPPAASPGAGSVDATSPRTGQIARLAAKFEAAPEGGPANGSVPPPASEMGAPRSAEEPAAGERSEGGADPGAGMLLEFRGVIEELVRQGGVRSCLRTFHPRRMSLLTHLLFSSFCLLICCCISCSSVMPDEVGHVDELIGEYGGREAVLLETLTAMREDDELMSQYSALTESSSSDGSPAKRVRSASPGSGGGGGPADAMATIADGDEEGSVWDGGSSADGRSATPADAPGATGRTAGESLEQYKGGEGEPAGHLEINAHGEVVSHFRDLSQAAEEPSARSVASSDAYIGDLCDAETASAVAVPTEETLRAHDAEDPGDGSGGTKAPDTSLDPKAGRSRRTRLVLALGLAAVLILGIVLGATLSGKGDGGANVSGSDCARFV